MAQNQLEPLTAIDRFLDAVRDAAAESPAFRAKLIDVLGFTVLYEGEEQFEGANPVTQAATWSEDAFLRIWSGAKVGEVKAVLKDQDLATTTDMRGLKKSDLISLLYDRSLKRAEELHLL